MPPPPPPIRSDRESVMGEVRRQNNKHHRPQHAVPHSISISIRLNSLEKSSRYSLHIKIKDGEKHQPLTRDSYFATASSKICKKLLKNHYSRHSEELLLCPLQAVEDTRADPGMARSLRSLRSICSCLRLGLNVLDDLLHIALLGRQSALEIRLLGLRRQEQQKRGGVGVVRKNIFASETTTSLADTIPNGSWGQSQPYLRLLWAKPA